MNVPDVEWIVEGFLPLGFKAILSGTTGSNKSYASMELGMRVADANEDGYVQLPNVKVLHEMVDMMTATRTYEANTAAVETTYQLATLALELGR